MFKALRQVFSHDDDQVVNLVSDQGNPNFITERPKILRLLQQIIESPPLCTVTIRHSNKPFFTSLLEIEKEKGLVVFDELTPEPGNQLLNQAGIGRLSTFINGVHLTFDLKEIVREVSGRQVTYKAQLPQTIFYPQRRSSPRFVTEPSTIDFQGISRDTGMLVKGYVMDISRTGLSLAFSKAGGSIQSGDKLNACEIQLPGDNVFSFDLSVRSIRKVSPTSLQKQIGGFFNSLSPQNQSRLDRSICALERQQIRKRKKLAAGL